MHRSQVAAERLLLIHISGGNREELIGQIEGFGYDVRNVDAIESALPLLTAEPVFPVVLIVACAVTDRMRSVHDELIEGIQRIRRASSDSQVILALDSSVDVSLCCKAINCGVAGFAEIEGGRVKKETLQKRLEQAREHYRLARIQAETLHSGEIFDKTGIIGCSRAMASLLSQTARVAEVSDAPVLIYGESGTGKQLLAEMIHRLDAKRLAKPFLSVNCAAITGTLAESALFGHVKGAFTGATEARAGYFRAADGGTIFLDEIGDLSPSLQPKLLRVLQEGMVMPVGSDKEHPVDVRVVAAANRRIPALVEEGKFRMDLYQRMNVLMLDIPPLRERVEDIPLLVDFFLKKYAHYYANPVKHVDPRVCAVLAQSPLEGNVREIENTIRRALAMKTEGNDLELSDLPASLLERHAAPVKTDAPVFATEMVESACALISSGTMTLPDFIDECERLVLARAIADSKDSHTDLSRRLGLSTRTLYNKRRKYRL